MGPAGTRTELVVARYRESLGWLDRLREPWPGLEVTVYDKSDDPWPGAIPLPNVGREAQTYLHHVIDGSTPWPTS